MAGKAGRIIFTLTVCLLAALPALHAFEPVDIGSQRELFVDHHLIDRLENARLVLHRPQPREVVFKFDQPWEGPYCGYETVLKDGDIFRLYYGSSEFSARTVGKGQS